MGTKPHKLAQKVRTRETASSRKVARSWKTTWPLLAVITLTTSIAFAPATQNGFTNWDDPPYVTENHQIRDLSFNGMRTIFSTFLQGNYHPVTMMSLAIDYHFWKLDPKGYHVTSVVLHVLNTLAVFALIFLLTGSRELSAITSLFFGIHPAHVESVAWVSARKDLLYVLFYLGACISYVFWIRKKRLKAAYYTAALALFLLSLLSKGMAVTLPLVLLLIDYYVRRGVPFQRLVLEKAPFFLLSVIFGLVAVVAQRGTGAITGLTLVPFYNRVLFGCYGLLAYLLKALLPVKLSAFYPYPNKMTDGLSPIFYIAPLFVAVIATGVYRSRRRERGVMFGALFYLVNVALVLQLIPVGRAIMADRYTYLSYIGVGFVLALGYRWLIHGPFARRGGLGRAVMVGLSMFGVALILTARARCEVWRDNTRLWSDVIGKYPTAGLAYKNRAMTYKERGDYELAMADLNGALSLNQSDPEALCNRGNLFYLKGDSERALGDLDMAIRLDPSVAAAWNSRGAVRSSLGRYDQALADFSKAIELKRDFPEAFLNRANTFLATRKFPEALADYNTYFGYEHGDARAHLWRGMARLSLGDAAGARDDYGIALKINPRFGDAYLFRSKAFAALGEYDSALQDALRAQAIGYSVEQSYLDTLRKAAR